MAKPSLPCLESQCLSIGTTVLSRVHRRTSSARAIHSVLRCKQVHCKQGIFPVHHARLERKMRSASSMRRCAAPPLPTLPSQSLLAYLEKSTYRGLSPSTPKRYGFKEWTSFPSTPSISVKYAGFLSIAHWFKHLGEREVRISQNIFLKSVGISTKAHN